MATGKPELDTVNINGVNVDSYKTSVDGRSWFFDKGNNTIQFINIHLNMGVSAVLTIDESLNGKPVTVQRGVSSATEEYVFRGEVVNVIPQGSIVTIVAADKLIKATKRKVTYSFDKDIDSEAGKYSEIFKTLVNDYTDLTADSSSVQDSGTIRTIKKFRCKSANVFEKLTILANTLGWQMGYSPITDKVFFEPRGFTAQSTSFETGVNILETPKWDTDASQLFNEVEIRGAKQEVETTETGQIGVTSGYTTDSVLLQNKPKSVKVYCDSSNPPTTLRYGGVPSATANYDYSVDVDNKKIIWSDSYTPGGSDYVQVDYSYLQPTPVIVHDEASMIKYSEDPDNPEYKSTVLHKPDIVNVDDAQEYATQFLDDHKEAIERTTLKVTNVKDIRVGQKVSIIDNINNKTGDYYITGVSISAPYRYDSVSVASVVINEDNYNWNIQQRVKRLEENESGDQDALLHVVSSSKTVKIKKRYSKAEKTNIGHAFIVGHPINSKIGLGNLGVDGQQITIGTGGKGSSEDIRIIWPNRKYIETFMDDDFKDSATTANWDTTNKQLSYS